MFLGGRRFLAHLRYARETREEISCRSAYFTRCGSGEPRSGFVLHSEKLHALGLKRVPAVHKTRVAKRTGRRILSLWGRSTTAMKVVITIIFSASLFLLAGCCPKRADYTVGASSVCEVHKTKMTKAEVFDWPSNMSYCPTALGAATDIEAGKSFPNASDWAFVESGEDRPRKAIIYVCPKCLEAKQKWLVEAEKKYKTK